MLILAAILCWPNYATAQTRIPNTIVAESPAGNINVSAEAQLDIIHSETSLEELMQRETALEENLFGLRRDDPLLRGAGYVRRGISRICAGVGVREIGAAGGGWNRARVRTRTRVRDGGRRTISSVRLRLRETW